MPTFRARCASLAPALAECQPGRSVLEKPCVSSVGGNPCKHSQKRCWSLPQSPWVKWNLRFQIAAHPRDPQKCWVPTPRRALPGAQRQVESPWVLGREKKRPSPGVLSVFPYLGVPGPALGAARVLCPSPNSANMAIGGPDELGTVRGTGGLGGGDPDEAWPQWPV